MTKGSLLRSHNCAGNQYGRAGRLTLISSEVSTTLASFLKLAKHLRSHLLAILEISTMVRIVIYKSDIRKGWRTPL